jgi:hypothetical protein
VNDIVFRFLTCNYTRFFLSEVRSKSHEYFKVGYERLFTLRSANGYVLHHDAITGTSTANVTQMYINYLIDGMKGVSPVTSTALSQLISNKIEIPLNFHMTHNLTHLKTHDLVPIVLFNSLGWSRNHTFVTLLVNSNNIVITDKSENKLRVSIYPRGSHFAAVVEVPHIPPLGFETIFLRNGPLKSIQQDEQVEKPSNSFSISNEVYDVVFCDYGNNQQRICRIRNKHSGVQINVEQNLLQYISFDGNKTAEGTSSGAYVFRPATPQKFPFAQNISTTLRTLSNVVEVHQVFSPFAKQTVRLFNSNPGNMDEDQFIEIEFEIGVMDEDREMISQFTTNIANGDIFYSDNNGYTSLKRYKQAGSDVQPQLNYKPTQYSSFIKDNIAQLTILSDHSHGTTSLQNGQIEYMLHRRCSVDDLRGLNEPLNDTTIVTFKLRLLVDTPERSDMYRHHQAHLLNFPVDSFPIDTSDSIWKKLDITSAHQYSQLFTTKYSAVNYDLPYHIHLLTLQAHTLSNPELGLLRLQNIVEEKHSAIVKVDQWFSNSTIHIQRSQETKLSANQVKDDKKLEADLNVMLSPTQIRTYLVTVNK